MAGIFRYETCLHGAVLALVGVAQRADGVAAAAAAHRRPGVELAGPAARWRVEMVLCDFQYWKEISEEDL